MNKKVLVILAYTVAAIFFGLAIVYFVTPADQLPSFIPGHAAGSTKAHFKHGLAALCLSLGSAAFAWFQGGPKSTQEQ